MRDSLVILAILPENPVMMTRIYFAVELAGALVGDFALVADADLLGDVDALKQRIKASRSRLRDVELGDMTVFGVWGAKPTVAVWKAKLLDGDAALDPADTLGTLIGDMERAYIIVHITAPPPAAATVVAPPSRTTAAGFAGVTDHFRAVLAGAGVTVDEAVVRRIYESAALSVRLQVFSSPDEALLLYETAQRIPQSETRASVLRETGFVVDGDISMPHPSTSLFFWAFNHGAPRVLKIPAVPDVALSECELYRELGTEAIRQGIALVPVRTLELHRSSHCSAYGGHDRVRLVERGVIMPHYPVAMAQLPPQCVTNAGLFDRMAAAITFIATAGWLHGDVKPSNIFIDSEGQGWLGDFGSSLRLDDADRLFRGGTPQYQIEGVPFTAPGGAFDMAGLVLSFVHTLGLLSAGSRIPTPWPAVAVRFAVQRVESTPLRERLERVLDSSGSLSNGAASN